MKLVLIRHGDPDYVNDALTETGQIEAEMLSERLLRMQIAEVYVSPLGRAKETAAPTLAKLQRTAVELEWLREFEARVIRPDGPADRRLITWDWLPADWTGWDGFYHYETWWRHPVFLEAKVKEEYDRVTGLFDVFLREHGYEKDGNLFRVTRANSDTIVMFCHYGLTVVLISYLLHVSPMILWHGLVAAPTSVTTIMTEEREQGIASFRVNAYGDTSHLYVHDQEPSFSARFCERYDNVNERHTWKV